MHGTGERSAVDSNSGEPVLPVRSGAEATYSCTNGWPNSSGSPYPSPQPKTGRGAGQSPAITREREALALSPSVDAFDESAIRQLIEFFELLDRWDQEAHAN